MANGKGKSVAAKDKGLRSNGKEKTSSRTASFVAVKRQGKLPSRQGKARGKWQGKPSSVNFLGQRQMASLSKQGKGKFRRIPAAT